jgi:hypothetical protein
VRVELVLPVRVAEHAHSHLYVGMPLRALAQQRGGWGRPQAQGHVEAGRPTRSEEEEDAAGVGIRPVEED